MPSQKRINFALLGDGPTDAALMPVLHWALRRSPSVHTILGHFANEAYLPPAANGLGPRIMEVLRLFQCNLLFVHRDGEKQGRDARLTEISAALETLPTFQRPATVPVIPIRMTEAWLLFSETAIRHAAGNPNGIAALALPGVSFVEQRPDPKKILHDALIAASERKGRMLAKFNVNQAAKRVAEYVDDFSPLRQLPSFVAFEADLARTLAHM